MAKLGLVDVVVCVVVVWLVLDFTLSLDFLVAVGSATFSLGFAVPFWGLAVPLAGFAVPFACAGGFLSLGKFSSSGVEMVNPDEVSSVFACAACCAGFGL